MADTGGVTSARDAARSAPNPNSTAHPSSTSENLLRVTPDVLTTNLLAGRESLTPGAGT
jgi:hypothetical protein